MADSKDMKEKEPDADDKGKGKGFVPFGAKTGKYIKKRPPKKGK